MPIFEVECLNEYCKHKQEVIVITRQEKERLEEDLEDDLVLCEKCGCPTEKVMSVPAKGVVK